MTAPVYAPAREPAAPRRTPPAAAPPAGSAAWALRLQRSAGNRAAAGLLATAGAQRGPGPATPQQVQRTPVDVGAAVDAGRYVGEPQADADKAGALNALNGLSHDDQVASVRRLRAEQRLGLEAALRNGVGTGVVDVPRIWVAITMATADSAAAKRAAEMHGLVRAGVYLAPKPPFGAFGLLADLRPAERVQTLRLLHVDHIMELAKHFPAASTNPGTSGVSRDLDGVRDAIITAVSTTPDLAVKRVPFDVDYFANPFDAGKAAGAAGTAAPTAAGASTYVLSQGEHAWTKSPIVNGRRLVSTRYWRALVPTARAIELERDIGSLPRGLGSKLESWKAEQLRSGRPLTGGTEVHVTHGGGRSSFTVQELESVGDIIRRYNTKGLDGITLGERMLVYDVQKIHVGAPFDQTPVVSWSTKGETPRFDGKNFRVKAEFDRTRVMDNTKANGLNLGQDNADESEWLAFGDKDARITSVRRMADGKGLGARSTQFAFDRSTALRWGGRGLLVLSVAMSVKRVLGAADDDMGQVFLEELGSQVGGFGGAALGAGACVALGIATGGVGLLACGLVGGIVGGTAGGLLLPAGVSALQGTGGAGNPMDYVPRDPSGQPIYLGGDAGLPPPVLEY